MKKISVLFVAACVGLGVAFGFAPPLHAQMKGAPVPFSADWANYEQGQRQESGKYYASGEGLRLEGVAGGESFAVIYNFERRVAWNLIESERMYIETSLDSDELGMDDLGQFGTPCPPEAEATRIGSETWQGRRTEKWTCLAPGEPVTTIWFDTKLQAVIRSENEDGRFELTNIREGRQPASLFAPPAGYTKMEIPIYGMPPSGAPSSRGQQPGAMSMEEMMRSLMQEQQEKPETGRPQPKADDDTPGLREGLRGLFGR